MRRRPSTPRPWRERLSGTPRLVLAVVLLAAGTLVALTATAPAAAGPVVVATHRIAAGAVLDAADVTVARHVRDQLPEGALTDPARAVGHRTVATVPRGAVVTGAGLAPEGFTAALGPGRAVATATVAAGRAAVVQVGDVLRLVAAATSDPLAAGPDTTPVTLSDDARVLAVWGTPDSEVATVVVDVDVGSASRLAVLPPDLLVGCVVLTA